MNQKNSEETIGYVGDVRMLEEGGFTEVNKDVLNAWAEKSNETEFSTLFYSQQDNWAVEKQKEEILQINETITLKKIDTIQEFKDYIDSGMNRELHPVRDVDMVNINSSWNEDIVKYMHENVPSTKDQEITKNIIEKFKKEFETEENKINPKGISDNNMTLSEAFEKVKKDNHYDEAKFVGDEIINTAGNIKSHADDAKDIHNGTYTSNMSKTFESLNSIKSMKLPDKEKHLGDGVFQNKTVKELGSELGSSKNILKGMAGYGVASSLYGAYDSGKNISKASDNLRKNDKIINNKLEQCINDANEPTSPTFGEDIACVEEQLKAKIGNLVHFTTEASGHPELEKSMKKIAGLDEKENQVEVGRSNILNDENIVSGESVEIMREYDVSKEIEQNNNLDHSLKVQEILEQSNLTDFNQGNENDYGMYIGD